MKRAELDGLIRVARPAEEPSSTDRERVRQGLARRIAAHAPEPELPPPGSANGWNAKWALTLGAVAGVAGVIALVLWSGSEGPERPVPGPMITTSSPEASRLPAPATRAAEVPSPDAAPAAPIVAHAPPPAAPPQSAARASQRVEHRPSVTSPSLNLAAESRGLGEVQAALRDGMPARALALLSAQDREFAGGVLVEERSAARAMALCAGTDRAAGRRAADEFARRYPSSALGARVRQACADEATGAR